MKRMNFPGRKAKRRTEADKRRFKFLNSIPYVMWKSDDTKFMAAQIGGSNG